MAVSYAGAHGSHRAEHEARQKVAGVRERIEKLVTEMVGRRPEHDADGDYVRPVDDVHVIVAPRAEVLSEQRVVGSASPFGWSPPPPTSGTIA